jgi:hypothetical protein
MKLWVLICVNLFLLSGLCLAADGGGGIAEKFRYAAVLTSEEGENYTSVRLTPEIIGKSRSDLADLLLVSDGQAVPYFINSYSIARNMSVTVYEMDLADSYIKDPFQYLDYRLSPEPSGGSDIAATSINIAAFGQFVKDIALYGSYDGMNWDFVADDSIFQVEGSQKLSVSLLPREKYTWYRFRVSGGQEPVSFDRVWLEYSLDTVSKNAFAETLTPPMTVRQDKKTTVIALNGLRNLTLTDIEIKTDSMFKRNVSVNGVSHTLYNLVFGGERYRGLTLPMNRYQCPSDQLEIRVDNGDDVPIEVDSVTVSYLTYDVVFQNTRAPVTLYFGGNGISEPPRYDIASYKEHILAEGYGRTGISEITGQPVEPPQEAAPPDYTLFFNITIIAAAVLLAALLATRLKKVK